MLDSCIVCKCIWLAHVLPFCVEQDLLLMWLDGCIACRRILLLRVMSFDDKQDFPSEMYYSLQEYLTPSRTIAFYLSRFFLWGTWWPQILQLYLRSCYGKFWYEYPLLCCIQPDVHNSHKKPCLYYPWWFPWGQCIYQIFRFSYMIWIMSLEFIFDPSYLNKVPR